MEVGLVKTIEINDEMQQAYLDYAMSVIVARALPDARDGLKPVHRRILFAMYDMGLRPDSSYKKSARIVGEVLGKYHPHGDQAVYDAMARMAQDFSMRYMLVDGQGNFGSVDGDPPAAMRYTEARLQTPAQHMLEDIDKDTINFTENFDGTLQEPGVLPAALPNLLVNGATGIAVGMSTSIPPHNLGEVVDALQYMLTNWRRLDNIPVETLMNFIQGPDFPTGGVIIQPAGGDVLVGAYSTGRGRITVQARSHLEEMGRGKNRIIVTELPYMTNKASLIERIADLAREEKVEGIVDLRDESDRQGMRIVIELSKNADPQAVLASLHKFTPMQGTFSIIMLALVNGEPRLLSLKQALRVYLEHRLEIIQRRSQYELEKARKRAHILTGLQIALNNMDAVIDIIRRSRTVETARKTLRKRFKLSVAQAQAILDMPLRRLAALERKKIIDELKALKRRIRELENLLRSPLKMRKLVAEELGTVKEAHTDRRRTHIIQLEKGKKQASIMSASELVPEKNVWIMVGRNGEIARTLEDKAPRLSGKEAPTWLVKANSRDTLYLVCQDGEAAALPVHSLPEATAPSEGTVFTSITPLRSGKKIGALFTLPSVPGGDKADAGFDDMYVLTVTRQGMVKKSALSDLPGAAANSFTLVKVNDGDELGWLRISNGKNDVLLASAKGMAIRFSEADVRPMGLVAAGVMGMKLQSKDEVVGMDLLPGEGEIFLIASHGIAKRVVPTQFPKQGRYGQGVVAWKLPGKERVAGMTIGKGTARIGVHTSRLQPKTLRLDAAPVQGRTARGRAVIEVKSPSRVTAITIPWETPRPKPKAKSTRRKTKRVEKTSTKKTKK